MYFNVCFVPIEVEGQVILNVYQIHLVMGQNWKNNSSGLAFDQHKMIFYVFCTLGELTQF